MQCYSVALHKRLVSAPVHAGYCYLTVTQTPPFQKNPVSAPADQYAFDIIIGTFLAWVGLYESAHLHSDSILFTWDLYSIVFVPGQ